MQMRSTQKSVERQEKIFLVICRHRCIKKGKTTASCLPVPILIVLQDFGGIAGGR